MRSAVQRAVVLLFLISCKPGPPPVQNVTPLMHSTGETFDTFSLGDPVGSFVDRYGAACDDDPIDKERSMLFFWAGADGCKEQKPFPEETTVLVLTPYNKAWRDQPIDLLAYYGGTYYNNRSSLKIRIGDAAADADKKLGELVHKTDVGNVSGPDGPIANLRQATYANDVHVLIRDEKIVGIAVGKLKGGEEREHALANGYAHHLRYPPVTSP
jgi:hypothetical protein